MKTRWLKVGLVLALFAVLLVGCVELLESSNAPTEPASTTRGVGSCQTFAASGLPLTIPDDSATGITSTLTMPGISGKVTYIYVAVGIDHDAPWDLTASLMPPNRCGNTLVHECLDGTPFAGTVAFSNAGDHPVTYLDNPYSGVYLPVETFAKNIPAGGAWSLHMVDPWAGTEGTLTSWSLTVCTDSAGLARVPTMTPTYVPAVYLFDYNDFATAHPTPFAQWDGKCEGPNGLLALADPIASPGNANCYIDGSNGVCEWKIYMCNAGGTAVNCTVSVTSEGSGTSGSWSAGYNGAYYDALNGPDWSDNGTQTEFTGCKYTSLAQSYNVFLNPVHGKTGDQACWYPEQEWNQFVAEVYGRAAWAVPCTYSASMNISCEKPGPWPTATPGPCSSGGGGWVIW